MKLLSRITTDNDVIHKKYANTEINTLHATINDEKVDWDDTEEWRVSEIAEIWNTIWETTEVGNGN